MIKSRRIEGETAILTIPSKGVDYEVLIDAVDLERVLQYTWNIFRRLYTSYVRTNVRKPDGTQTVLLLHRFLTDAPPELEVDHIFHDGLDNRKSQLRVVTKSMNGLNRRGPDSDSSSGYRGVTWREGEKKWQAQVRVAGRLCQLGLYLSAQEAGIVAAAFRALLEAQGITTAAEASLYARAFRAAYRAAKLRDAVLLDGERAA